jgi:hypothetical protein
MMVPMEPPGRHSILLPVAFGCVTGALGAAWILADYTRKAYALGYHVPLAVVFTAALVDATYDGLRTRQWGFHYAMGLAGAIIVGRMVEDWPLSGHGILGLLLAVAPIRPAFRVGGALVAVQALITKWVLGEPWMAVVWGAACGAALGALARGLDRLTARRGARAGASETAGSPPRT